MRAIAVVATAVAAAAAAVTNAAMPNGWKFVKLTWLVIDAKGMAWMVPLVMSEWDIKIKDSLIKIIFGVLEAVNEKT